MQVRSLVLFVTHYPPLGELEGVHPGVVRNYHMAYVEAKDNGMPFTWAIYLNLIPTSKMLVFDLVWFQIYMERSMRF